MSDSTAPADLTIYVDTNCFLQLRDMADLPWATIADGANHIEIAIAQPVVRELDKFKVDRDERRRNRARAAFVHIDRASVEPNLTCVLRAALPSVALRICGYSRLPWSDYDNLDPDSADDRLVLTALTDRCEGKKLLMSFDRGPLINGRLHGLDVLASPDDWRLPDQKDEQTIEIEKLKRELATLKAGRPQVTAHLTQNGEKTGRITVRILQPPPLTLETCQLLRDRWMQRTRAASPPDIAAISKVTAMWDRFIPEEEKVAYEEARQSFPDALVSFFQTLHDDIARVSQYGQIGYHLENTSSVTAKSLVVDLQIPRGVDIQRKVADSLRRDLIKWPAPPAKPKASFIANTERMQAAILPPMSLGPRDPTSFVWLREPHKGAPSIAWKCDEFRPAQVRDGELVVSTQDETLSDALHLKLSAENMSGPVDVQAGLVVTREAVGWTDPDVLKHMPGWLGKVLSALDQ